jgi:DNA end-binding protein Ku
MARRRPSWEGYLKLSLVSCPVRAYTATAHANTVSFHLINPETNNRIQMRPFDPETGEVSRGELVKGYEFEKGKYVTIDKEDLENIKLVSNKTIEVEEFVAAGGVDPIYFDAPYYMVPEGKVGTEAFLVIREAMRRAGKLALGRVVLFNRERRVAIDVRGNGLLMTTLKSAQEVRDAAAYFDEVPDLDVDCRMVEIAERIVEQLSGRFDPEAFEDRYEIALRELVESKIAGAEPVRAAEPEPANVVNLMDALKRSLSHGDAKPERASSRPARREHRSRRHAGARR